MSQSTRKNAIVSTFAIFGSRILGLVREQILAFFFGAGAVLDAFFVAFRIPNLLRDLAAEGALSQSFVAIFSKRIALQQKSQAFVLANKVKSFIFVLMTILVTLGIIFAPQLVRFIGMGFTGDKFDLTVSLLRILFPYILLVSLSALMMGMLNSLGKFFIPHSASTIFNLTSIISGLAFAYWLSPEYMSQTWNHLIHGTKLTDLDFLASAHAIMGMAWGALVGGLAQYAFQLPIAFKQGYRIKPDFQFKDPGLKEVLLLTAPAIIGGAAVQVNVMLNTMFASMLPDGSVSYLNYAFRFMQFPLGVFGVAIASASAPALARLVVQNKLDDFRKTIQSSLEMSLFLAIPSAVGLIVLGQEIIALIYQHGQFSANDSKQTAMALMAYSMGIVSYSLIKIYQPAFLAFHNAKTPMRIAMFSILINASVNAYFIFQLKLPHWALALGTAIVAAFNLILLSVFFGKHLKGIWTNEIFWSVFKIIVASAAMGVATWHTTIYLHKVFYLSSLWHRLLIVFGSIATAGTVYALVGALIGVKETRTILNKLLAFRK